MGRSQWQHYLPQVFLKGFGTSSGEVWRYDRANGALKCLPVRVIGAERDLYSIITGGELSHEIETKWFSPLDGCFGPILRKIEKKDEPSSVELLDLANFVAYLRVRTPAAIRQAELDIRQLKDQLGPDTDSVNYNPGPPNHGPDSFVMTDEQFESVSARRANGVLRNEVLTVLVQTGVQLGRALLDLEWTFLFAGQGRSFVVADDPFAIVPPRSHDIHSEGVGPMTPGAATFVPLSSRICLRLTKADNHFCGHSRVDGAAVRSINACQVLNSERYLFAPNDALLKRLTADMICEVGLNMGELVLRQAASVSDASRNLLHSFRRSKVGNEWAERVPMQ
jgi:hypothetical protein